MERDSTETAYDLFTHIACAAMLAAPGSDAGLNHFRETLIALAAMCVSGVAGLSTDRAHAIEVIADMMRRPPEIDVLEVIRLNT